MVRITMISTLQYWYYCNHRN